MGEADYPKLLQAADSAPPLLAVRGDAAILNRPAVAIVGSRNASAAGLAFTERLAGGLGRGGLRRRLRASRAASTPAPTRPRSATGTVAVLAGGHDRIYPAKHAALLERILERKAGRWSPRCRWAGSRAGATFPAATASSRGWPTAPWWSRPPAARAR